MALIENFSFSKIEISKFEIVSDGIDQLTERFYHFKLTLFPEIDFIPLKIVNGVFCISLI